MHAVIKNKTHAVVKLTESTVECPHPGRLQVVRSMEDTYMFHHDLAWNLAAPCLLPHHGEVALNLSAWLLPLLHLNFYRIAYEPYLSIENKTLQQHIPSGFSTGGLVGLV